MSEIDGVVARVTIVIPTLCEAKRRGGLERAIESIRGAARSPVRILVVVNGRRFDSDLLGWLRGNENLEVLQLDEGSLTKAQLEGRRRVKTEFFGFLDDDDEYLPEALDLRLEALRNDPSADLVVTNGFRVTVSEKRLVYSRLATAGRNPLRRIFEENWLAAGNHLFRTATVTTSYFEDPHPLMEWTWLAFMFASDGMKVVFHDTPTFVYNDTPESLSKSGGFTRSRCALYKKMRSRGVDATISKLLARKACDAWHDVSVQELERGHFGLAIGAHVRSLISHWSGLRFLAYTRHLLFPAASKRTSP